jgi:hypothetical protein
MLNRASIFEKKLLIRLSNLRFCVKNHSRDHPEYHDFFLIYARALRVFVQFYTFSALYFVIFTHFWHLRYKNSACWDEQAEESP